jgi:hypothetical protein
MDNFWNTSGKMSTLSPPRQPTLLLLTRSQTAGRVQKSPATSDPCCILATLVTASKTTHHDLAGPTQIPRLQQLA